MALSPEDPAAFNSDGSGSKTLLKYGSSAKFCDILLKSFYCPQSLLLIILIFFVMSYRHHGNCGLLGFGNSLSTTYLYGFRRHPPYHYLKVSSIAASLPPSAETSKKMLPKDLLSNASHQHISVPNSPITIQYTLDNLDGLLSHHKS